MNAVDLFVIYDNIQFTKKGWIHRNRILVDGTDVFISLFLKNDSDFLDIRDRYISSPKQDNLKLLRRIEGSYRKAPYFSAAMPVVEKCLNFDNDNLFSFVHHSVIITASYLGIHTPVITSSELAVDHSQKGKDKVIGICHHLGADIYVNLPGGKGLYDQSEFLRNGIKLKFLQPGQITYQQPCSVFVPWLSIIDVLMFNSIETIQGYLQKYELVDS